MTIQTQKFPSIDLADLVSQLVSSTAGDRKIDQIVDVMLGGDKVRDSIIPFDVKATSWIASEVPHYTSDSRAVLLLAHRRKIKVSSAKGEFGFDARAIDIQTGNEVVVTASSQQSAEIAAIASSVIRNRNV